MGYIDPENPNAWWNKPAFRHSTHTPEDGTSTGAIITQVPWCMLQRDAHGEGDEPATISMRQSDCPICERDALATRVADLNSALIHEQEVATEAVNTSGEALESVFSIARILGWEYGDYLEAAKFSREKIETLVAQVAVMAEELAFVRGERDWPERKPGEGAYWWRKRLLRTEDVPARAAALIEAMRMARSAIVRLSSHHTHDFAVIGGRCSKCNEIDDTLAALDAAGIGGSDA